MAADAVAALLVLFFAAKPHFFELEEYAFFALMALVYSADGGLAAFYRDVAPGLQVGAVVGDDVLPGQLQVGSLACRDADVGCADAARLNVTDFLFVVAAAAFFVDDAVFLAGAGVDFFADVFAVVQLYALRTVQVDVAFATVQLGGHAKQFAAGKDVQVAVAAGVYAALYAFKAVFVIAGVFAVHVFVEDVFRHEAA